MASGDSERDARLAEAFALWHATLDLAAVRGRFPECADEIAELAHAHTAAAGTPPFALLGPEQVRVPGYRLLRELGRGTTGVVFEAVQEALDRRVALKLLWPRSDAGGRIEQEARAAARLRHPGIVTVYDVGTAAGRCWLAMELVEGTCLRDAIHQTGRGLATRLPAGTRARARFLAPRFAVLAEALAHAHAREVIHRDIKPANIVLSEDGSLRLLDFGIATTPAGDRDGTEGTPVGTPHTMAPEQARGELLAIDPRSDVYGLGATLHEALTLRPAVAGDGFADTVAQVLAGSPPPPRAVDPAVPAELNAVVRKAMARAPAQRYASAALLAEDLRAFAAGLPVRARPWRLLRRVWSWPRRHPVRCALVVSILILAGALMFLWRRIDGLQLEREIRGLTLDMADLTLDSAQPDAQREATLARVQALIARRPDHLRLRFLEAFGLCALGRHREARQRVLAAEVEGETALGQLLLTYLTQGEPGAERHAERVRQLEPQAPEELILAASLEELCQPERALRLYTQALLTRDLEQSLRGYILQRRGTMLVWAGRLDQAEQDLREAARLLPATLAPRGLLVWALRTAARPQAEAAALADIRAAAAGNPLLTVTAARPLIDMTPPEPSLARAILGEEPAPGALGCSRWLALRLTLAAMTGGSDGDRELAARAGREFPDDREVQTQLVYFYSSLGQPEAAACAMANADRMGPASAVTWLRRAMAFVANGQLAEGEQALARAAAAGASAASRGLVEGLLASVRGQPEVALDRALLAARAAPGSPHVLMAVSRALSDLGRIEEASQWSRRAWERLPAKSEYAQIHAAQLERLSGPDAALGFLREAAVKNPGSGRNLQWVSMLLGRLGRAPEALAVIDQALALEPESCDMWLWQGLLLHTHDAGGPERRHEAFTALRRGLSGRVFLRDQVVAAGRILLDEGEPADRERVGAALARLTRSVATLPTVLLAPLGRMLRELQDLDGVERVRAELQRRAAPRAAR